MIVLVLENAKPGLRGHVTRWLTEVASGVYVGAPSARVRERLWQLVVDRIGGGCAVLIRPHPTSEQHWVVQTVGSSSRELVDFDGLMLPRRRRRRRVTREEPDGRGGTTS